MKVVVVSLLLYKDGFLELSLKTVPRELDYSHAKLDLAEILPFLEDNQVLQHVAGAPESGHVVDVLPCRLAQGVLLDSGNVVLLARRHSSSCSLERGFFLADLSGA